MPATPMTTGPRLHKAHERVKTTTAPVRRPPLGREAPERATTTVEQLGGLLHPRKRRTRAPVLTGGPGAAPGGVASKIFD